MAIVHETVISFSRVTIPISMYTAAKDNSIHFKQLHKFDNLKIKYKYYTCGHCGKEFKIKSLIKGYEYAKDHYIVVTDDALISLLDKATWKE